ncbi:MAG: sulfatase-like hydrolase/transferase [Alphaproteobacteria bacterium]|nr:sulfatase-like hydrolase/transferase [Alphaproteobacteria bacterium]
MIVADDLGTDKLASYGEHPKAPRTPRLDALAARSVLFRNAYANPVCSPTRAALLTGRYGRRTGFGAIVEIANDADELPLAEELVPEMLERSNPAWTSVAYGKWHLSGYKSPTGLKHPNAQGFDHYAGALGNLFYTSTDRRATWRSFEKVVDGEVRWVEEYATTDTTDDAVAFLQHHRSGPFFLYVAYNAPHTPFHLPPVKLYPGHLEKDATDIEKFDAVVTAMDTEIGRLLDTMTPEQRATTYVVFVGDNGTDRDAILPPLDPSHGKLSVFEGGVNVPLLVSGPGVRPGETQALVHVVDLLPTIAEAAGATPRAEIDGVSFLSVLGDPSRAGKREFVYLERFHPLGGGPFDLELRAVRDARYKLIVDKGGSEMFYDLRGRFDDGEGTDVSRLAGPEREAARRLEAELQRIERTVHYAY